MPMKLFLSFIIIGLILPGRLISAEVVDKPIDVVEIVKTIDQLYRSISSETEVEMTIITPNWKRRLRLNMWTEGLEKTFIHILSPKKDAGIATLRVMKSMWNYFPKINKVIKVPPSMMMASWMGSDFTNDDLVKESSLLGDYTAKIIACEDSQPDHLCIELKPKKKTATVWGKIILIVQKEEIIPVQQIFFDEKGEKIRAMTFSDVRMFGERKMPATLELVSLKSKDKKTIMRYIKAKFDTKIDESIFTRRNLQKKR